MVNESAPCDVSTSHGAKLLLLFPIQRLDWVQLRGIAGWEHSENYADNHRY